MTDEVERIGGTFVADGSPAGPFEEREAVVPPQVLYASLDSFTAEDLEAMRKALDETPPVIVKAEDPMVQDLKERVKHLEEKDLENQRQMMDLQGRVSSLEGYSPFMMNKIAECEARCKSMAMTMTLGMVTVVASLAVTCVSLLHGMGLL